MSAPYGYDRERRGGGLVGAGDVGSAADPTRTGLPGPRQLDRSIHGGMELAMEQNLRLDSTDSEFGGDDGSIGQFFDTFNSPANRSHVGLCDSS